MPIRRRTNAPRKFVTLKEALGWIAFDDFADPYASLSKSSSKFDLSEAGGDAYESQAILASYQGQREQLEEELAGPQGDLFAALRDDEIQARGRFSDRYAHNFSENDWQEQLYENHAAERSGIPAEFWWPEGVNWEANSAKSPHGEFADVILESKAVLLLWPREEAPADAGLEKSERISREEIGRKRGPKERYSEREFFALCAWEASANYLPDTQAELVRRMAELCAVIWGEGQTPGETWLKAKVKYLYEFRDKYERSRQLMEGSGNSDRSKTSG